MFYQMKDLPIIIKVTNLGDHVDFAMSRLIIFGFGILGISIGLSGTLEAAKGKRNTYTISTYHHSQQNPRYDLEERKRQGNLPYYSGYNRYYNQRPYPQTTNTYYLTNGNYYGEEPPRTVIRFPDKKVSNQASE